VGVAWLFAALFYPVILVVLGLTGAAVFISDMWRERRLPAAFWSNALLGAAALLIAIVSSRAPSGLGPTVTGDQAMIMAEFRPGGRLPMFGLPFSADWFNDHHLALGWPWYSAIPFGAALLFLWWTGQLRTIPYAGWALLAIGLGVWLFSRQILFTLYLPNRHARWSVACFVILAAAAVIGALTERVLTRRRLAENVQLTALLNGAIAVLAPLLVAAALLPGALRDLRQPVDSDLERAYVFIASLPKDTLVAAHPDLADFVPLRSRRSVLVSTEIALPFMLGYYGQLRPRIIASLRAAYATSLAEMDESLRPFGTDVMLTRASVFQKPDYFRPYDQLTQELRERGRRRGFVLRSPPADRVLFRSGDVLIVRVDPGPAGS
jgi:hypothetical protein